MENGHIVHVSSLVYLCYYITCDNWHYGLVFSDCSSMV